MASAACVTVGRMATDENNIPSTEEALHELFTNSLLPRWSPGMDVAQIVLTGPDENGWQRFSAMVRMPQPG
jgi:hypothetical protein